MKSISFCVVMLCLGTLAHGAAPPADAQAPAGALPQGPGLSAKYPGDAGISRDPAIFFADDFESGDMKKWDDRSGTIKATTDKPHAGRNCASAEMNRGKDHGGEAKKWFMPGADTVYARFYVKFSSNYKYNHHFVWLLANEKKNKWSAFGKAGNKPDGTYFSTGMEPSFGNGKNAPPGEVNFYSYFIDMKPDGKMKYWGNAFFPPGPGAGKSAGPGRIIPPLDRWQCWEFMIRANSMPAKTDGRQAMWIDGKLVGDFPGIHWRTDTELKINCFWLEHYGMDGGDPTKKYWPDKQAVWFDDVIVAREYIGPMVEPAAKDGK